MGDGETETALIIECNANKTELTGRMGGREKGGERGTNAPCNVKRTRCYFHFIPCWCSLYPLRKTPHSLAVIANICFFML